LTGVSQPPGTCPNDGPAAVSIIDHQTIATTVHPALRAAVTEAVMTPSLRAWNHCPPVYWPLQSSFTANLEARLLLARSRRPGMSAEWSLSRAKRTFQPTAPVLNETVPCAASMLARLSPAD